MERFRLRELLPALAHVGELRRRLPARRVYFKQVYFSGIETLPLVMLVGVAASGIIVGELRLFGQSGDEALRLLAAITLGELAPLLTAIVVSARSVPAMASELAAMQVNGEVRLLARLGVPPVDYLVMPRLYGMATACALLTGYLATLSLVAGAAFTDGFNLFFALERLGESLQPGAILLCLLKSVLFGFAMAIVACRAGLAAEIGSITQVPVAASRSVVRSLAIVLLLDLLMVTL